MASLWEVHRDCWKDCTKCELHKNRRKIVLARNDLPAQVIFVGEGPGRTENMSGRPFDGPSGNLLNRIIKWATEGMPDITMAMINLVACLPVDGNGKIVEPAPAEIKACSPRVIDFIRIADPDLVVAVGRLAEHWLPKLLADRPNKRGVVPKIIHITHPSSILQAPATSQGLMTQSTIIDLREAFEELLDQ